MKVTNNGAGARILPVGNGYVEIERGATAEIADADWSALKKRDTVKADISDGTLVEEAPEAGVPKRTTSKKAEV